VGATRRPALLLGATGPVPASARKKIFRVDHIRGSSLAETHHKPFAYKDFRYVRPRHKNPRIGSSQEQMPSNKVATAVLRRCESCLVEQPLEQFRRRYRNRDPRVRCCRQCHNLRERLRRTGIRHRISRSRMTKAMTHLRHCTDATRAVTFCAEMVQHLGGAEGFLNAWKGCIDRDLEKGGLPAVRHLAVLLKLMEYCEPEPVDYSTMSDEELMERAIAAGLNPDEHHP
jgi:hypothetical protein